MNIWLDADACPKGAKELLFRAAERHKIPLILVANQRMAVPKSEWIQTLWVEKGFDVADAAIVAQVQAGDLVVTSDIPLAAEVVDRGAVVLDSRGVVYDAENVKMKLATRNLMMSLRDEGLVSGGPPPYTPADRHRFASALNTTLLALLKGQH
ncbi:MAG: YaiI/YqxD family protein [Acidobacteria bacterium]|nr:YaiI/YqxD family protein [Acidobacteriota bacterium]MCB9399537.1 YaiI/YqxD family protein [Acidobacteriota bacterium]